MDDFFNETVPAAPGSGLIAAPDSGGFGSGSFVAAPSSGGFAAPSSGGFAAPPSGELNGGLSAPYSSGSSGSVFDDPSLRHEFETGSYSGGFIPTYDAPALREYEHSQAQRLEEKTRESERKFQEVLAQANAETEKFYEERRVRLQKAAAANRENERKSVIPEPSLPLAQDEAWNRVGKLVDLNTKPDTTRDTSRFKEVLQAVVKA